MEVIVFVDLGLIALLACFAFCLFFGQVAFFTKFIVPLWRIVFIAEIVMYAIYIILTIRENIDIYKKAKNKKIFQLFFKAVFFLLKTIPNYLFILIISVFMFSDFAYVALLVRDSAGLFELISASVDMFVVAAVLFLVLCGFIWTKVNAYEVLESHLIDEYYLWSVFNILYSIVAGAILLLELQGDCYIYGFHALFDGNIVGTIINFLLTSINNFIGLFM